LQECGSLLSGIQQPFGTVISAAAVCICGAELSGGVHKDRQVSSWMDKGGVLASNNYSVSDQVNESEDKWLLILGR